MILLRARNVEMKFPVSIIRHKSPGKEKHTTSKQVYNLLMRHKRHQQDTVHMIDEQKKNIKCIKHTTVSGDY